MSKKVILFSVIGLLVIGLVAGGLFFMGVFGGEEEEVAEAEVVEKPKEKIYFEFQPPFLVNFENQTAKKFMQIDLVAMSYEQSAVEALEHHMPIIRNNLLLIFGEKDSEALSTREGKESLRKETLEAVRLVMKEQFGDEAIEDVYFTKFVMQ